MVTSGLPNPKIHLVVVSIGISSSIPLQRTQSAWIILLLLSRITNMVVAPTAIASASVSCLSSSSLLSVKKKKRNHMRLLALHCNPRLVFCGGHFWMMPLHNNGTKIGMDNDQSSVAQLPVSKAFLVVVWLSCLQTRPADQRYPRPPCPRGPWPRDCFQYHLLNNTIC